MGEFRSISYCNVVYKCIMKIIANRLLPRLDYIVSNNQATFDPHHSISKNVLLAQELVKDYHMDEGSPWCTIKADLRKANDSVNWDHPALFVMLLNFFSLFFCMD